VYKVNKHFILETKKLGHPSGDPRLNYFHIHLRHVHLQIMHQTYWIETKRCKQKGTDY